MSYVRSFEPGEDDQLICPSCDYSGGPEEFDGPFESVDPHFGNDYFECPECGTTILVP